MAGRHEREEGALLYLEMRVSIKRLAANSRSGREFRRGCEGTYCTV